MTELPRFARFWMVCRKPMHPGARTEPRQRYGTRAEAEETAGRLANETNAPHLVLETVAVIRPGEAKQGGLF
ncbi:hypothetical protein BOO69_08185 [Sulfitobacter alexandrii]|uniref:DUF2188 domain-containing protein n=1 Tax=Sulfitobacter alexandrii TaxID=1917485 RepID=A0A1J0WGG2_9RHOB|nr:hypothetical protein [Sulfitobacter alexandrii]APE43395.1 hypothetical protein BOO69_08185 [Sulfitobacter alexandrii]